MLEFKPRTHSDPDLPQLLPLPVRPHSSYQAKLQFKDQAQFEEKIVHAMAQKLGIDLIKVLLQILLHRYLYIDTLLYFFTILIDIFLLLLSNYYF